MSNGTPALGAIRLYDSIQPDLAPGDYRFTSSLEISAVGGGAQQEPPLAQTAYVCVTAPRFRLGNEAVSSFHPPPQGTGAFDDRLPHIALGRRTLPWERVGTDATTPWMALLVVRKDEVVNPALETGMLEDLIPSLAQSLHKEVSDEDRRVTVVRLKSLATFRDILPSKDDIRLLTHVRQVNLADSELAGQDDDGWFAVVTANRLPIGEREGTDYLACLVSLEGRSDLWSIPNDQPPPPLIVLFSWTFKSTDAGGTFEHIAQRIDFAPFGATARGSLALVAADGTLPLQRVDRQGSASTVHYRGPLLGTAAPSLAGSARDNDISLMAASELGRLVGSADGPFLRQMTAWHCQSERDARANLVGLQLMSTLGVCASRSLAPGPATAEAVKQTVARELSELGGGETAYWRVHPAGDQLRKEKPQGIKARGLKRRRQGRAR